MKDYLENLGSEGLKELEELEDEILVLEILIGIHKEEFTNLGTLSPQTVKLSADVLNSLFSSRHF